MTTAATAGQPTPPTPTLPEEPQEPERLGCVRFGCTDQATWIVTHPRGGLLPCCDPDLDDVLNDALAAIPRHSTARIQIYRP